MTFSKFKTKGERLEKSEERKAKENDFIDEYFEQTEFSSKLELKKESNLTSFFQQK